MHREWCIQVRRKNNLANGGCVLFWNRLFYHPHGPLPQMCYVGARVRVCLHSGFINGNGIMIAQACPIPIIPQTVKASQIWTCQLPQFLCDFCCCWPAPDHTACLRQPACFTICFCLNVPSTIQMTSGPQLPLCINTWLCQILLYRRDTWCNQPNVLAIPWSLLTPTLDMLISPSTIPIVFFALLHYCFLFLLKFKSWPLLTNACFFVLLFVFLVFSFGKKNQTIQDLLCSNAPFSLEQFRHFKNKFCIICSGFWLCCTFGLHLRSVLLDQAKIYAWVLNWRASLTAEVILEICGVGQLSPLLKQQTTSACQHLNLWLLCVGVNVCMCVRSSYSFRLLRHLNVTFFFLSKTWSFFQLSSQRKRAQKIVHLSAGGRCRAVFWPHVEHQGCICVLSQPAAKPQEDKLILVLLSRLRQKSIACLPPQC